MTNEPTRCRYCGHDSHAADRLCDLCRRHHEKGRNYDPANAHPGDELKGGDWVNVGGIQRYIRRGAA